MLSWLINLIVLSWLFIVLSFLNRLYNSLSWLFNILSLRSFAIKKTFRGTFFNWFGFINWFILFCILLLSWTLSFNSFNLLLSLNWLLIILCFLDFFWYLILSCNNNNLLFLFLSLKLIIDQFIIPLLINSPNPLYPISIFPFPISLDSIFVHKVTKTMLFLVLPSTIINLSITPCLNSKTMLLVIFELTNILIAISIDTYSLSLSLSLNPVSSVSILALPHFSSLSMLKPFSNLLIILLLSSSTLCRWLFRFNNNINGISMIHCPFCQLFRIIFWNNSDITIRPKVLWLLDFLFILLLILLFF